MQLNEIRVDPLTNRQEDPVGNRPEQGSSMAMPEIQGTSSQTNERSSWFSDIMGVEEAKSKRRAGPMIPKVRDKLLKDEKQGMLRALGGLNRSLSPYGSSKQAPRDGETEGSDGTSIRPVFFPKPKSGSYGHNLYYSAKDLQKNLQPESMLLNLVAYETAVSLDEPNWVTSYICFIDSLIDDAEDVKVLRSKGILTNYLGPDQKVAELFNQIGRSLQPNTNAYNEIQREINIACESIWKKWIAEWQQTYFSSPWAFTAFVAASAGLVLTATQTYYTVYPISGGT
ncbi:hypothetical protein OIU76_010509 [Salix suchowensis]|nr:hypothetical protein OIU76_010509 [Salix suchowensis]